MRIVRLLRVSGPLADLLFFAAVTAIVLSHMLIVRSTRRGMLAGAVRASRVSEMVWALLPALMLIALLVWTWFTMHPMSMTFTFPADRPLGGIAT
jgi:heme/copper-type cytochrome/quinol oxidase subunit 2